MRAAALLALAAAPIGAQSPEPREARDLIRTSDAVFRLTQHVPLAGTGVAHGVAEGLWAVDGRAVKLRGGGAHHFTAVTDTGDGHEAAVRSPVPEPVVSEVTLGCGTDEARPGRTCARFAWRYVDLPAPVSGVAVRGGTGTATLVASDGRWGVESLTVRPDGAAYPTPPRGAQAPPGVPPDAQISVGDDTPKEESWFVNGHVHDPVTVRIEGAGVDASSCGGLRVEYAFLHNGDGTKVPTVVVPAYWTESGGARCEASVRWRLSGEAGRQVLRARLVREDKDGRLASPPAPDVAAMQVHDFRVTAHAQPAPIIGLTLTKFTRDDAEADRLVPLVGVDLPVVVRAFEDLSPALDRLRFMVATEADNPGDHLYLGVELLPLVAGPRAGAFPLQVTAGYRIGDDDEGFVSLHYNATNLLSSILTAVGFSK